MQLSPVILTREEAQSFSPLYPDMASDRLIIQDEDGFFAGVQRMARWGSERLGAGGHRLWLIRPGLKWKDVLDNDE